MKPDYRGGFGFGLGSAGAEAVGQTINATITSNSCTTGRIFRPGSATAGMRYFVVTALDEAGNESSCSNEVTVTPPN